MVSQEYYQVRRCFRELDDEKDTSRSSRTLSPSTLAYSKRSPQGLSPSYTSPPTYYTSKSEKSAHIYDYYPIHDYPSSPTTPSTTRTCLKSILATICIVVISLLALALPLGWSYYQRFSTLTAKGGLAGAIHQHVVLTRPSSLNVVNVTHWGAWLNVEGGMGVDAASMMGVQQGDNAQSSGCHSGVGSDAKKAWRALGRWGIRTLGTVRVRLEGVEVRGTFLDPDTNREENRFFKFITMPMDVPVSVDAPGDFQNDSSWLSPISTQVFVHPAGGMKFQDVLDEVSKMKMIRMHVRIRQTTVRLWGLESGPGMCSGIWNWVAGLLEMSVRDMRIEKNFSCVFSKLSEFDMLLTCSTFCWQDL